VIEDGTYDVFVVDATPLEGAAGGLRLEVTILAGPHKGEVVSINAAGLRVDELDAIGTPGTLTVSGGQPSIALEP